MLLFTVALGVVVVALVRYLLSAKAIKDDNLSSFPVAAGAVPLLGHLPAIAELPRLRDVLERMGADERARGAPTFRLLLPGKRVLVLTELDDIVHIMHANTVRPDNMGTDERFNDAALALGLNHLTTKRGADWRRERRALGPAFTPSAVRRYVSDMKMFARRFSKALARNVDAHGGADNDAWLPKLVSFFSLDVLTKLVFDTDLNEMEKRGIGCDTTTTAAAAAAANGDTTFADDLVGMFPGFARMLMLPVATWHLPFGIGALVDPTTQRYIESVGRLNTRVFGLLKTLRADIDAPGETRSSSILARIMEGESLPDDRLRANALGLQAAGYDTTSALIRSVLAFLSFNDAAQTRMRTELSALVDDDGVMRDDRIVDAKWAYTRACVWEALRIAMPFPLFSFATFGNSVTLPSGTRLPPHTETFSLPNGVTLRDEYFTDAAQFAPERWLVPRDEQRFPRHVERAFMPFGGGIKACPGQHVAVLETLAAVAVVVSRYRLRPSTLARRRGAKQPRFDYAFVQMIDTVCDLERL